MAQARIVRVQKFGGPEVLKVETLDVPAPDANEVRIRVAVIGLNRVEAMFRNGDFGEAPLPAGIGYEAAGTIEAVGPGVTDFKVGDRVATIPGAMAQRHATYGELILYPADMLVSSPEGQPEDEAAATWMAYLTAYGLIGVTAVKAGDAVLINAASSSVGLAAIQIVKAEGGTAIALTRGRAKVDALKDAGADHVIVTDEQDVVAETEAITGGKGAQIAFDAVAGRPLLALLQALAPLGQILNYGSLGGDEITLPAHILALAGITLRGYAMGQLMGDPASRRAAIAYVKDGLANGTLEPVIARRFDLADIVQAHEYLEGNSQFGKIVVTVG